VTGKARQTLAGMSTAEDWQSRARVPRRIDWTAANMTATWKTMAWMASTVCRELTCTEAEFSDGND
jgi:hypothetical protein